MKDFNFRDSELKDWRKKLNKQLVESIKEQNPTEVKFFYSEDDVIVCVIKTEDGTGIGIAIKSPIDEFDERHGRNKAAGRALSATVNKVNNDGIRCDWNEFPKNWTKSKIDFLRNFGYVFVYKSVWLDKTISLPEFITVD
jgi:hypothetical protein